MIALDCETTGLELHHSARPFMAGVVDEYGVSSLFEWAVNPISRTPTVLLQDKLSLKQILQGQSVTFHNANFDLRALATVGIVLSFTSPAFTTPLFFPEKVTGKPVVIECEELHDTQLMSHAWDNRGTGDKDAPHKLKPLAFHYLDIPDDDEKELKQAVIAARRIGKKLGWSLGVNLKGENETDYDYWMPKACHDLLQQGRKLAAHPQHSKEYKKLYEPVLDVPFTWGKLCSIYATGDVTRTLGLFFFFKELLEADGLWANYEKERQLIPVTYMMEYTGMYCQPKEEFKRFEKEAERCRKKASKLLGGININSGPQLADHLQSLKAPIGKRTKKGKVSTDAEALRDLAQYLEAKKTLPNTSAGLRYLIGFDPEKDDPGEERVPGYRTYVSGVRYLKGYDLVLDQAGFIHPSFNQSGTSWTRYSSSNPNGQNVSKKAVLPLRSVFGPPPGFIWLAIDYSQLEIRVYAYGAKDRGLIELLESGYDFHAVTALVIYGKPKEEQTSEQRRIAKNTNFCILFGGGPGKIDATSGRPGTWDKFSKQFPNAKSFMQEIINRVRKDGYVLTLDGRRLYPPPAEPYKGLSGVVQGTAGAIMKLAMLDIHQRELVDWKPDGSSIVANIHDEAIFQIPLAYPWKSIGRRLIKVMEEAGQRLGVTTPCEAKLIETNWASGKPFK